MMMTVLLQDGMKGVNDDDPVLHLRPTDETTRSGATSAQTPGTGSPKQRLFSGGVRQPLRSSGPGAQPTSTLPVRPSAQIGVPAKTERPAAPGCYTNRIPNI